MGTYRYATSNKEVGGTFSARLNTIFRECVTSFDYAQNMVVIKTLPGLASAACSAIDAMNMSVVVGSLATIRRSLLCGTITRRRPSARRSRSCCSVRPGAGGNQMLSLLHIENIAVIEAADIAFDRGFNVLTGETGAGKSIVIDAINAILGERTYRDVIRTGANKATVRAVFAGVPELAWFSEFEVPYGDELLVQRQIFLDGKNVCRVNGLPVTVATLKKLGLQLVQIHGQHRQPAAL